MSNQTVVRDQIKRFGQECVVTWPALGTGQTARTAVSVNSFVRISQRSTFNAGGQQAYATTAMLPAIDASGAALPYHLQGAQITVPGKTYNVAGATELVANGITYMLKAQLT